MSIGKTYRRLNKAIRVAQSGEAEGVLAAAHEILEARIKNGNALSSPSTVRDYLRLHLHGREHEVFVVVLLNAQNRVIATEEMFRGTLTQTSVYPREVVKMALRHNAAAVILAHNHPSGVSEPSGADQMITSALKQCCRRLNIDHLFRFNFDQRRDAIH